MKKVVALWVMMLKINKRKGSLAIELILLTPLWIIMLFYILMEFTYSSKMNELEENGRIILRNVIKLNENGNSALRELMQEYGYKNYSVNYYEFKNNKLVLISVDKDIWKEDHLVELTITEYTSLYKKGLTDFKVGDNNFVLPRTKCTVTIRMIIQGGCDTFSSSGGCE